MKELNVFLHSTKEKKRIVGKLADFKNSFFFQYDASFLADPLWLSPYKLPPEQGLQEHKDRNFGPIFGLFDDSLPDGWGLLLMVRFFRKQGIDTDRLSILDRLSFLGKSTMGALTYEPTVQREKNNVDINLQALSEQSGQILSGDAAEVLPLLMRIGGSPGGARPKVLLGVKGNELISGDDDIPEGFEHWIVKFNSKGDISDPGAVEYAYSLMAKEAGLSMPETRLFEVSSGDLFFGVKRFDREKNQRFHVHTFGNLIHSNFRIPQCDYGTFLKVVFDLTKNHQDLKQGFRQMVFNVLANNRDDHVKNFAFMIDKNQEWTLTPAYDLTYSKGLGGEHSMSLAGEGLSPGRKEIVQLGHGSGVSTKDIGIIINQVMAAIERWTDHAQAANVTEQTKDYIQKKMYKNIAAMTEKKG